MKEDLKRVLEALSPTDWKRGIAMIILWAYAYQLLLWPLWFNIITFINAVHGTSLPAPIIVPWEQLMAGTTTLAAIGGIQAWRDGNATPDGTPPQ